MPACITLTRRPHPPPAAFARFQRRAICWWTLGYGFAYGKDIGGFIGGDGFAFSGDAHEGTDQGIATAQWFFQWAFAGAS